jgi:hypothetical protein
MGRSSCVVEEREEGLGNRRRGQAESAMEREAKGINEKAVKEVWRRCIEGV